MWNAALDAMGWLIALSYRFIPSYGVALILLTVVVRLVLFPLTAKGIRSMQKMQQIQPEIKKLQAKHKGDRQKLNEEMMKFYQENKINPFGGCLPLLAQMPVFIVLSRVLYKIQFHIPRTGSNGRLYRDVCGAVAPSRCKSPKLDFLGMNLSSHASSVSGSKLTPYIILIALVVVTAYVQQKQAMRNQTQVNPQMQMVTRIMPVFFGFISYSVPAGLTLYFLVSNVWQIGQQELVYHKMPPPGELPKGKGAVIDVPESSSGGGGILSRLLKPPTPPDRPATSEPDASASKPDGGGSKPDGSTSKSDGGSKQDGGGSKQDGGTSKPQPDRPSASRPNRPNRRRNKKRRR